MLTVTSNTVEYRQKQRPSVHVATTLYDLIEAVSEQVPAERGVFAHSGSAEAVEGLQGRLLIQHAQLNICCAPF